MAPPTGMMKEMGTTLVSPYLKSTKAWEELTHFFTTPGRVRRNKQNPVRTVVGLLPLCSVLGLVAYVCLNEHSLVIPAGGREESDIV